MSEVEGEGCEGNVTPSGGEKVNGTSTVSEDTPDPPKTDMSTDPPSAEATTAAAPPVAKPKYRHDWYQTETDVCINVLIKRVKKENVKVDFQEKSVSTITHIVLSLIPLLTCCSR